MKRLLPAAALLALLLTAPARADALLAGGREVREALKGGPPCCVIDGRSAKQRQASELAGALPYRPGLEIKPEANVVVIADSDREALRIAGIFAARHPERRIVAIKGGLAGWQAALAAESSEAAAAGAPPGGIEFVIPHNTCEVGTPLQTLKSKAK